MQYSIINTLIQYNQFNTFINIKHKKYLMLFLKIIDEDFPVSKFSCLIFVSKFSVSLKIYYVEDYVQVPSRKWGCGRDGLGMELAPLLM